MPYKRRKKNPSGFKKYCSVQLNSVKKARSATTRSKSALRYQKCLQKKGVKTGAGKVKEKK